MPIGYDGLPPSYINDGTLTPNLKLSLSGQDAVSAGNFVLIDANTANSLPIDSMIDSFGITSCGSGDNALYTVPPGKYALVNLFVNNPTAGAITVFPTITTVTDGLIHRTQVNSVLAAAGSNPNTANFQNQVVLLANPGDVIGLNCTSLGINAYAPVVLLNTNNPNSWKSANLTTFINGNNTIYTVPTGKIAYLAYAAFSPIGTVGTQVFYSNESGNTATISLNIVPSGGSVALTNRVASPASIANNSSNNFSMSKKMSAGDFLSINTNQTGKQFFSCIVLEQSA